MSDLQKQIEVITKEEAIDKAVEFLDKSKKPNIVPNTSNLCFGLAGLSMFEAGADKTEVKRVFFSITKKTSEMSTSFPLIDRINIIDFYDCYYKEAFVDINKAQQVCYAPVLENDLCGAISFSVYNKFQSVALLMEGLKKNNNKLFATIISEIAKKKYGSKGDVGNTAIVSGAFEGPSPKKPVAFAFSNPSAIERVAFDDRLDVFSFYDSYYKDNLILCKITDMEYFVLIPMKKKVCGIIPISMVSRFPCVKLLVDSLKDRWESSEKELFKK